MRVGKDVLGYHNCVDAGVESGRGQLKEGETEGKAHAVESELCGL